MLVFIELFVLFLCVAAGFLGIGLGVGLGLGLALGAGVVVGVGVWVWVWVWDKFYTYQDHWVSESIDRERRGNNRGRDGNNDDDDDENNLQTRGRRFENDPVEDGDGPSRVEARKVLVEKNLFGRIIRREESVQELSALLAASRGRDGGGAVVGEEEGPTTTAVVPDDPDEERGLGGGGVVAAGAAGGGEIVCGVGPPTTTTTATPVVVAIAIAVEMTVRHKMECSICLDQFSPGNEIAWAKDGGDPPPPSSSSSSAPAAGENVGCDHIFHRGCLVAWLMNHDECPLCRSRLVHADADVRFAGWEMR